MEKIKILYISGESRSGSTILEQILGQTDIFPYWEVSTSLDGSINQISILL